jgi:hypothetical protein
MTTPSWMPPLPNADIPRMKYREFTAEQMRAYAEAYRKAWVARLKPVAWMDDFGNPFPLAANKGSASWMDEHKRNWVPLYRLDDSQKDDQP